MSQLISPTTAAEIQIRIDKARGIVAAVQSQIATNPGLVVLSIGRASKKYQTIRNQLTGIVARQTPTGPLVMYTSVLVRNITLKPVVITGVSCNVHVTPLTSAPFDITGDITALVPAGSGNQLPFTVFPNSNSFKIDNAIDYAIAERIGFEFVQHVHGSVTLKLKGSPKESFLVSR